MTKSDPIGLWLAASIATGVTAHVALAALNRRAYHRLREAHAGAVSEAHQTGAVDALVRAQELHREFMRAAPPGWLTGFGARLRAALVVWAVAGLAVMITTGRLPSALGGVAVLFALGLRRILLAAALLLALFAASSVLSPPRPADRAPAAQLAAPRNAAKASPARWP